MPTAITKVEVLGPGCARCQEVHRIVRQVVEELGLTCAVVKSESYPRMIELGIMATPAIAIAGKVVMAGRVPKADEVRRALGVA